MSLKNLKKPSLIKPKKFRDRRGFFQELHLEKKFNLKIKFTASAYSKKNVIRGLHFQFKNMQSKLIYVSSGKILDIAVNLKKKSPNFGKVYKFILNEGDMVYIPEFYAHGYECLSKTCKVIYHLEKYRDPKNESGLPYNDKTLKIKWKTKKPIVSIRDKSHNSMKDFINKYKGL